MTTLAERFAQGVVGDPARREVCPGMSPASARGRNTCSAPGRRGAAARPIRPVTRSSRPISTCICSTGAYS